jgi:hypothetical protein
MSDEYVQTGTYTESICRIEYDYTGPNTVHCKFCAEMEVVLEEDRPRSFITQLRLQGWNVRSRGILGFVIECYHPEDAIQVEVPAMTRVPDEDVPAMYIDERPL